MDPVPACIECAVEGTPALIAAFQASRPPRHHLDHNPKEYQQQKVRLLGAGGPKLDRVHPRMGLPARLRECTTWQEVYAVCMSLHLESEWLGVPAYLGHPLRLEVEFSQAMHIIYKLGCKMSLLFVLRKLAQARGNPDYRWVPLKISKETLLKTEKDWKQVCYLMGIPYQETAHAEVAVPWQP